MKTIVFRHRTGFRRDGFYEEEVTFDDDTIEEEINSAFTDWVWQEVGDHFTWYEKDQS